MDYYSSMKMKEILTFAVIQMDLAGVIPREMLDR